MIGQLELTNILMQGWNKQYMTKLDKMGIEQFQLVGKFIIWCLFSFLIKSSETSLGVVVI